MKKVEVWNVYPGVKRDEESWERGVLSQRSSAGIELVETKNETTPGFLDPPVEKLN